MFRSLRILALTLLLALSGAYAQGTSIFTFLLVPPASGLNGQAGAYTALPTTDFLGAFFNPAQLGNFGREKNIAFQSYTRKTDWLAGLSLSDVTFDSRGLALGYNLESIFPDMPLSLGFAYYSGSLDLGTNIITDNNGTVIDRFDAREYYSAWSFGVGIDYVLRFNLGYTLKKATSDVFPEKRNADVYDIGAQAILPVMAMWDEPYTVFNDQKVSFDVALGLALVNNGDAVNASGSVVPERLAREARIGYAFTWGLDKQFEGFSIQTIKISWSSEARDELVQAGQYTAFPGNIDIWDNMILGKSSADITVHSGWSVTVLEMIRYQRGHYKGGGFPEFVKTGGLSLSSRGLVNGLSLLLELPALRTANDHFEVNYFYSWYTGGNEALNGTAFSGINLSIHGF